MLTHFGLELLLEGHEILLVSIEALVELLLSVLLCYLGRRVVEIPLVVRLLGSGLFL